MRKIILALLLLYIVSPLDLIPDFFKPIGLLDDTVAAFLFYSLLRNPALLQKMTAFFFRDRQDSSPNRDPTDARSEPTQTPWEVLGLSENATPEEIKTAHRQRSQEYHPDKVQHLGADLRDLADKKFREIQNAFETLQKRR